ncbi:hypothetical protein EC968_007607 [Mortierella alpina]|nr:hypothetical protein EC968_007607 [Mortierella alpina]
MLKHEKQRTRRRTALSQLATALGPAWAPSVSQTSSPPGTRFGKRIRKQAQVFTPSHSRRRLISKSLPPSQKERSLSKTRSQSQSRSWSLEERKLHDAAHASRLHAHGLCVEEFELFKHHLCRADLENYLRVRNTMLWMWRESPKEPLTLTKAFEATKFYGLHQGLIAHVYEFLLRSGYINFGACAFQKHPLEDPEDVPYHTTIGSSSAARKTVLVIGGGIAGIGAARQLENLFRYYSWKFAPELPPRVIVLEARGRIGGRMHSLELESKVAAPNAESTCSPAKQDQKSTFDRPKVNPHTATDPRLSSPEFDRTKHHVKHAVDLGAQIITGFDNGNPMEIIVRRQLSDLDLHYLINESCDLFGHDGKLVSKTLDQHCEAVFNHILDKACQLRQDKELPMRLKVYLKERLMTGGSDPGRVRTTALPTLGHCMDYFIESHPEFTSWTDRELDLIHWHYANLEFANATPLDQLSLRHWDQDDDYEFSGPHSMVKEGYGQVPILLSQGLDVRLNKVVTKIKHAASSPLPSTTPRTRTSQGDHAEQGDYAEPVQVKCRDGTSLECSAVVITVPLGVLKSKQIAFSPGLPQWKEQAIRQLGFGLLNKLVLVFEKPFWNLADELFGYARNGEEVRSAEDYDRRAYRSCRGKFYMFWNCMEVSGLPVLVTLMAGQSAYDCEKMSKEDLVEEAMQTLALIYPHLQLPTPIETVVTRWSQDEFAQGSYSFVGKDGDGQDYDQLAKPIENRLYFAGEATCRQYPATAHGAYLSGIKVAKDILDMLIGPQLVLSQQSNSIGDSHGIGSENRKYHRHDLENDKRYTQLTSVEDSRTTHSPSPHQETVSSQMHLGHGFVIPRRRGRVSTRMLAKFVADRSDDDVEEEYGNGNGIDSINCWTDLKDFKGSLSYGKDNQVNVDGFNPTANAVHDTRGRIIPHPQGDAQTPSSSEPVVLKKRGPGRPRKVMASGTDPADPPRKRLRGPGRPKATPLPEASCSSIVPLKRKPGRPKGTSRKARSAQGPIKGASAEANQLEIKSVLFGESSEEASHPPVVVRPTKQAASTSSSAARQTRSRYEAQYYSKT